jgi:hypothetical protein
MKQWIAAIVLAGLLTTQVSGAPKGPDIRVIDDKVSIDAESVPLGNLLRLFDKATGLTSKVPPELANRNVSVKFTDLSFDDAVRKIFEGQPLDYVVIGGQGIIVTALSQPGPNESAPVPVYNQGPPQIEQQTFIEDNSPIPAGGFAPPPPPGVVPGFAGAPPQGMPGAVPATPFNPQQQPAMIQTPFGPIPNPRANQPVQPGQVPGQNPFGNVAPFNPSNPFGAPQQQQPNQNNNVFGNTSPPLFQNPTPAK